MNSDWFKLIMWLATLNPIALLLQRRVTTLLWILFMRLAPGLVVGGGDLLLWGRQFDTTRMWISHYFFYCLFWKRKFGSLLQRTDGSVQSIGLILKYTTYYYLVYQIFDRLKSRLQVIISVVPFVYFGILLEVSFLTVYS